VNPAATLGSAVRERLSNLVVATDQERAQTVR
jgi:hypothetical protein